MRREFILLKRRFDNIFYKEINASRKSEIL